MTSLPQSPLSPPEAAKELQARRSARSSLMDFTRYTMPGYSVNWHHRILCRALDRMVAGELRRLMVFMPPRAGKSELVSRRLPAYILGRAPDTDIIACSYTADLASRMNRDVQRIIDTDTYRRLFPATSLSGRNVRSNAFGSYLRNNDIFEVVGHRGVYRSAGVGGGITGMGFTFGIIDDPIKSAAEANSPTIRERIWEWYTASFGPRQGPNARILLTLTRWHHDDLAGRLLRLQDDEPDADRWEVISFPALAERDRQDADPRKEGEPIWPDREIFTAESLNRTRAVLGSKAFLSLYQQRPTPEEGGHFKLHWFGSFTPWSHADTDDAWMLTNAAGERKYVIKADCVIFQVCDPASTEKESADYTALGTFAVTPQADLLVLDMQRDQLGVDGIPPFVLEHALRWDPLFVGFEADGFQRAIADACRDRARMPPVRELSHQGKSKLVRATPAVIRAEAGQIYLPSSAGWLKAFRAELVQFTGLGDAHDDQVDVLAYGAAQAQYLAGTSGPEWIGQERREASGWNSSAEGRGLFGRR